MRIQRVVTKQGHAVPNNSHAPQGPFPPELFRDPVIITEYTSLDDEHPEGATAQNEFRSPRMFRCNYCKLVVLEHEMANHICSGGEDGEDS